MTEPPVDCTEPAEPVGLIAYLCLAIDVVSMKVFLRLIAQDAGFLDAHLFFYDRYSQLADYHRQRGRIDHAERLQAIAERHYRAAPDDEPDPEAAAMAMPVPRPPIVTNAVSRARLGSSKQSGNSDATTGSSEVIH